MSDHLYQVLLKRETEMVNEIQRQVVRSNASHYTDLDWEVLLRRIESLVAYFLMSVRETPGIFTSYIAEIAKDRIKEGVRLAETLMIMRILEEQVWNIIVEDIEVPGRTASLARVTHTIGEAKDHLAEIWVEQGPQVEVDTEHVG